MHTWVHGGGAPVAVAVLFTASPPAVAGARLARTLAQCVLPATLEPLQELARLEHHNTPVSGAVCRLGVISRSGVWECNMLVPGVQQCGHGCYIDRGCLFGTHRSSFKSNIYLSETFRGQFPMLKVCVSSGTERKVKKRN